MRTTEIKMTSYFTKGNKTVGVHSFEEVKEGENRHYYKVWFSRYNPFPCFTMVTTMHVLFKWLEENGWKKNAGCYKATRIREIDDQTGEIVSEKEIRTSWIPVNNS